MLPINCGILKVHMKNKKNFLPNFWITKKKAKITCKEKIRILNGNIEDIKNLLEETYDEAILMGADPMQVKEVFNKVLKNIDSSLKSEK